MKGKECVVIGDNPDSSGDSREFGALSVKAVVSKVRWRWGMDGFQLPHHGRRPWEKSKVMVELAPGQERPT